MAYNVGRCSSFLRTVPCGHDLQKLQHGGVSEVLLFRRRRVLRAPSKARAPTAHAGFQ